VLEPQVEPGARTLAQPLPLTGQGEVAGGLRGPLEQGTAARLLGGAQEVLVDPLVDRGHGVEVRGPERLEGDGQRLLAQVGLVGHEEAAPDAHALDHEAVHVREGQEGEDGRLLARRGRDLPPALQQDVAGGRETAVTERAPHRTPGGAGGVGDHRRGVREHDAAQRLDRGERDHLAPLGQVVEGRRVQLPDVPQPGQRGAHRADRHDRLLVLHHHGHTAGVPQDPLDLVARRRRVDRHHLGADRPQRIAENRPLVPGACHDRHPVTGRDPAGDQPLRKVHDLVPELHRRDLLPASRGALGAAGEHRQGGVELRSLEDAVGQTPAGARQGPGSEGEVAHALLLTCTGCDCADELGHPRCSNVAQETARGACITEVVGHL